jgi:hypothetical protein
MSSWDENVDKKLWYETAEELNISLQSWLKKLMIQMTIYPGT